MKKFIASLLCFTLLLSFGLMGCGGAGSEKTPAVTEAVRTSSPETAGGGGLSAPGEFPVAKDKITLKFATLQHPAITDYSTNEFTKYMEEKTNVRIEWETVPSDDGQSEKVNLMLASGSYPDVFFGIEALKDAQLTQYGTQEKVFLPLETYIDKQAVELKKIFKEIQGSREEITSLDGHIYSMPEINQCYHCTYQTKMWVNRVWLDNLGMKLPATTDEFYEMLKAFKEKDPNKNGKKDEIPMAGAHKSGWENSIEKFLLNSFAYYDFDIYSTDNVGLCISNGKVDVPFYNGELKEGLKYLNKLYKEGLIYDGTFTQDNNQLTQLVENPDGELVGAIPSGYGGMFAQLGGDRYKQFVAISPLKGPKGVRGAASYPYEGVYPGRSVVTRNCKYPEAAVKWADYLYTFDGTTRLTRGVPDKDWRLPKDGEKGIDGNPALYVPLRPWNETDPQNDSFLQVGITKRNSAYRMGEYMDSKIDMYSGDGLEKLLYTVTKDLYEPYAKNDNALPHIKLTKEENDQLTTIKVELNKYMKDSLTKFIVGASSVDKDWDGFIRNIEKLQVKKVIDIYQQAYDRQFGK